MSKNHHLSNDPQISADQNDRMSGDDSGHGNRTSSTVGKEAKTPIETARPDDARDQATVEEFDQEGMGIAAKE